MSSATKVSPVVGNVPGPAGTVFLATIEPPMASAGMIMKNRPTSMSAASYGTSSLNNAGPHGLSEILYAYSSGAGNNGSAFAGLSANKFWNVTMGLTMLAGRFLMILPVLGIAGAMVGKKTVPTSLGTFPTNGWLFTALLVAVVVIVGALTFFPAVSLGPVVEHYVAAQGKVY